MTYCARIQRYSSRLRRCLLWGGGVQAVETILLKTNGCGSVSERRAAISRVHKIQPPDQVYGLDYMDYVRDVFVKESRTATIHASTVFVCCTVDSANVDASSISSDAIYVIVCPFLAFPKLTPLLKFCPYQCIYPPLPPRMVYGVVFMQCLFGFPLPLTCTYTGTNSNCSQSYIVQLQEDKQVIIGKQVVIYENGSTEVGQERPFSHPYIVIHGKVQHDNLIDSLNCIYL